MAKQKAITFGQFEKNLKYINAVDAGFIYRVTLRVAGRILTYVGKKNYKKWSKTKRQWVSSGWETYTTNSKSVNALLVYASDVKFEIINECITQRGLAASENKQIQADWEKYGAININLQYGRNNRREDYSEMQKAINIILESCIRRANYTTIIVGEK